MPGGLDNVLWNDYRGLERMLAGNGYSPEGKRVNGFALYQLREPYQIDSQPGTFLALRKSRLEPNSVETAIFWTGSSLEEAVGALGSLPAKTGGEAVRDKVFTYGNILGTFVLGFAVGSFAHSAEVGLGAAALYLAYRAAYALLQSYNHWQATLSVFGDNVKGKAALSRAIEFAEIHSY